jgi:antitoxin HicB
MKALSPMKPLEYYLNLKYPIEIVEDEGAWVASIPDLPGCHSFGDTVTEAIDNVQKTKTLWIEGQYRANAAIPEPENEDDYSGRFVLRIPKVLHKSLAYEATKQGVSLNQYASFLLAQRQPLNAFQHFAQSLFDSCANWQTPWFFSQHWHEQSLMMGRLNANTDLLVFLRKPPAEGAFKTAVPAYARKKYLLSQTR